MNQSEFGRTWLKDSQRRQTDFSNTDQNRGVPAPPVQKVYDPEAPRVALGSAQNWRDVIQDRKLDRLIQDRKSRQRFADEPLSLEALSFLLWATQGVRARLHESAVLRTVPSAGCRHPFETYIAALNVTGLTPAIFRYLPLDHALLQEHSPKNLAASLAAAAHGQDFAGQAAATFIWTALPARTEWRYAEASYKVIALDAGHVCQNLYLACEAINAGTCAIAAYNQDLMDALLSIDGEKEFTVYLAPVGKV